MTGPVPPPEAAALPAEAGLCANCRYSRLLRSKRSAFLRCARADLDPRFPRYPGLPVLSCRGFEAGAAPEPTWGPGVQAPDD